MKNMINFLLLHEPFHLLKKIRNNWCTDEKTQQLRYVDDAGIGKNAFAAWNDLISAHKKRIRMYCKTNITIIFSPLTVKNKSSSCPTRI